MYPIIVMEQDKYVDIEREFYDENCLWDGVADRNNLFDYVTLRKKRGEDHYAEIST